MNQEQPLTEEIVRRLLEAAGARVMSRGGRTEHYGSPREFSFEVKGVFANGLALHVVARQYTYREAWEEQGRVNDRVDVALLRDGVYSALPKGHEWFQGCDEETGVDAAALEDIVAIVRGINPKIYTLQQLTGDY